MTLFEYDREFDPPAPVLPVRIGTRDGADRVLTPMFVDTGADCTLIPVELAGRLGLPAVDTWVVSGIDGLARFLPVHEVRLECAGFDALVHVVAFEGQAILGRDVLNALLLHLDGPALRLRTGMRRRTRR